MKKAGVNFLIINLILSIFAFCFILNIDNINAEGDDDWPLNEEGIPTLPTQTESIDAIRKGLREENSGPGITSLPTSYSHQALRWLKIDPAPKGFALDKATGAYVKSTVGPGASGFGYSLSGIMEGVAWAGVVYFGIKMIGGLISDDYAKINAIANAASMGVMAGKTVYSLFGPNGWLSGTQTANWLAGFPGGITGLSIGAGIIVAAIVFYFTYKDIIIEKVTFQCLPWDAPTGGSNCEKCNNGLLPCSEYQCRSLGQACQLVNPGTKEAKCVWVNKNDVEFPIISPWNNALTSGYKYAPDNTISPPDSGVKIIKSSGTGCVGAFEPLSFGIFTNEPGKCKIDYLRKENFEDMDFFFGGSSTLKYNHTQIMSLPGASTTENGTVVLQNDGNYELFVRCQDANGNYNKGNFVFKFCVEQGPDTTPPIIATTNLINRMPIAYNKTEVNLEVYVNEPAECQWSRLDEEFKEMENAMSCATSVFEMNARMLYKCATTLTGLKSNQDNEFYFRCKDQPGKPENERNTNAESYKFVLTGTQPLVINSVGPNGTIKDSTESIKVTLTTGTSAGYNEGKANCYYSNTGGEDDYIMFYETDSHTHSQDLYLSEGSYKYWIKCLDLGGNSDVQTTEFDAESDTSAPIIVRAYNEESYLKMITNEKAECVYDVVDCNYLFADGEEIRTTNSKEHFTEWNTKMSMYAKCKDEFGNQPTPSECSIIVRAFDSSFD